MRAFPLKIKSKSDLVEVLYKVAVQEKSMGYILSVVGNLSKVVIQCPRNQQTDVLEGNLEIINLNGIISPEKCHLHLSISDNECKVWGGHLESGTIVSKEIDILIGFIDENEFKENNIVEFYILKDCLSSKRTVRFLNNLKISHKVNIISDDKSFLELKLKSQSNIFPQIFINGKFIGGYDQLISMSKNGELLELSNNTNL